MAVSVGAARLGGAARSVGGTSRRGLATAGRSARALLSPRGVRGVTIEAAWVAAHLATYPVGVLRERRRDDGRYQLRDLPPVQRGLVIGDVEAAGTPILLVHGMVDNRSIFTLLRRGLRRRGFGTVVTMNYSPVTNDVRAAATALAAEVEALVVESGYERVHVIGHSLGGLIARYYVQCLGGHERVHTLITLGTPHSGTWPAHLVPAGLCRQLRPGSDLYAELAAPAPHCGTRFIAYWSDLDQMMVPKRNARVDHPDLRARSVLVRGTGHMSLPVHIRVVRGICSALSQLDTGGDTLEAGLTPGKRSVG